MRLSHRRLVWRSLCGDGIVVDADLQPGAGLPDGADLGFLLLGPFICVGCYAISYALERGKQRPEINRRPAFRNNAKNIAIFAAVLGVLELLWAAPLVVFRPSTRVVCRKLATLRAFITLQNIPSVIGRI